MAYLLALPLAVFAMPAPAQWQTDYNIMVPEPVAPKHPAPKHRTPNSAPEQTAPERPAAKEATPKKHPRGSSVVVAPAPLPPPLHYNPPPVEAVVPPSRPVPPSMYVPQTGQVLPNLPGPGGSETSQDRALRCAHQAGVYGPGQTGDRNAYIGSCINQ